MIVDLCGALRFGRSVERYRGAGCTSAFRAALDDYFQRALATSGGKHPPRLLDEALARHSRLLAGGTMSAAAR